MRFYFYLSVIADRSEGNIISQSRVLVSNNYSGTASIRQDLQSSYL